MACIGGCSAARSLRAALLATCGLIASLAADAADSSAAQPFLDRWDLTLSTPDRDYASWLDITMQDSRLSVRMVGRWGHARELPSAEVAQGRIRFVSPKEEEGRDRTDMVFEGQLSGDALVGTTTGPDGTPWKWRGERAPPLQRDRPPRWQQPVELFNGRDLTGWHPSEGGAAASWYVKDGALISSGRGAELITNAKYDDFKLHIEFKIGPRANSGVYLRGRYEVQIEDDAQPEGPTQQLGAVYGFLAPSPPPARGSADWQAYDITLVGRTITVVLNGRTIIERREIPGITGGALDSHEAERGPIYLQGSEPGQVAFRNIVVTSARH